MRQITGLQSPIKTVDHTTSQLCGLVANAATASSPPSPIAAQLTGSNTTTALGLTGRGNAPVIDLCCKLSDAEHDPRLPLHVHRGATLALIVSSIGAAAGLEINGNGTSFRPRREPDAASPARQGRVEVSARPTGWHQQTKTILNFAAAAAKRAARIAVTIGQEGDSHGR
jgi:hypothetical protein